MAEPTGMAKDQKERGNSEQQMIRELAALLVETGLSEIEIEKSGLKIRVARNLAVTALAPQPPTATPPTTPSAATAQTAAPTEAGNDFANHPGCVTSPI